MARLKIRNFNYLTIALFLCISLHSTNATARDWWYVEAGVGYGNIEVTDTTFNPILPKAKLGFIIIPKLMLEVQYVGSGDDTSHGTQVQINEITAAFLRLDSGIRSGTRMYVLLGGSETSLTASDAGGINSKTDSYQDLAWGVGLEDRTWSEHTLLTLEYTQYYNYNNVSIASVSLGFKFEY